MIRRYARVLLVALVFVLPTQGIASVLSAFGSYYTDDDGVVYVHHDSSTPALDTHACDECADPLSWLDAPPLAGLTGMLSPMLDAGGLVLPSLFIPELPQRPPRG